VDRSRPITAADVSENSPSPGPLNGPPNNTGTLSVRLDVRTTILWWDVDGLRTDPASRRLNWHGASHSRHRQNLPGEPRKEASVDIWIKIDSVGTCRLLNQKDMWPLAPWKSTGADTLIGATGIIRASPGSPGCPSSVGSQAHMRTAPSRRAWTARDDEVGAIGDSTFPGYFWNIMVMLKHRIGLGSLGRIPVPASSGLYRRSSVMVTGTIARSRPHLHLKPIPPTAPMRIFGGYSWHQ